MSLSLSDSYWFIDLHLSGLTQTDLIPAAFMLAALLGYATYTDLFRGRIIPNAASMGVFALSFGVAPLIWDDLGRHYAWAVGMIVFLIICYFVGAMKEGDVKMLAGLSLLAGPAALPLFIIFGVCVVLYGIPTAARTIQRQRRDGEKLPFGRRLGEVPGGPALALSLPLTAALYGVPLVWVGGFIAVELFWFGFFWLDGVVAAKSESSDSSAESDPRDEDGEDHHSDSSAESDPRDEDGEDHHSDSSAESGPSGSPTDNESD